MTEVNRCESCGKIATRKERAGWIYQGVRKPPAPDAVDLARIWGSGDRPYPVLTDLCSWECVRDYAILQALDPQPASGEESGK